MRLPQPTGVLLTLDADLERLPSGEVRKTLKVLALLSSGRRRDGLFQRPRRAARRSSLHARLRRPRDRHL